MNYAIVRIGGKQYKVSEGETLSVDNLESKDGIVMLDDVLLLVNDKGAKVGSPKVSGAKVKAKILKSYKGDKVRVAKYKSKVRYRRITGFRPSLVQLKIEKIDTL
jgi:large subunit ribosomal protein L21